MSTSAQRLLRARARIEQRRELHAFISLSREEFADTQRGPIVAVKDLIDVRGLPTTGGSPAARRTPVGEDAPMLAGLRLVGGVVIGKTNLYEWAFGVTGHNEHYGDVANPIDPTRTAGGSSGGSAVAVAGGMCDWAIGTDTGGSIRIPASLCGVVGFKPSLGLIDTRGVLPLSRSLDTVGTLAGDVLTASRALEILSAKPLEFSELGAPRLAIPRGWVSEPELDEPTRVAWAGVAGSLPEVDFPGLERLGGLASTVLEWEAAAIHEERYRHAPERYGAEVRERLERVLGEKAAEHDGRYAAALAERPRASAAIELALEGFDAVLLPASACVAPLLGERERREPLFRFMRPFNYTGHPVIALPVPSPGLPVGVQLVGRLGGESQLASVALALERSWRGCSVARTP